MVTPPSLWWPPESVKPRPALASDRTVDVAIVGAGFTGLWTARELLRRDPTLSVALVEKHYAGFGASGRNGGWVSALFPLGDEAVKRRHGEDAWRHQRDVLRDAVANFGEALGEDGIEGDFVHGGTLTFARSALQRDRLRDNVDDGDEWLEGQALHDRGVIAGALGALFSPHCARIHPGKVVRQLAQRVEQLGATIYENSPVTAIRPRRGRRLAEVVTVSGTVRATYVVRATEGYTATFPGHRRDVAPVYSLMVATAPLAQTFWDEYGFHIMPTFADDRNHIIYGQRTADNRIAFGGRGAPYHYGSTIEDRFDHVEKVFRALESTVCELFPTLDAPFTHHWGGPLAMPRRREPSVVVDQTSGLAHAGGYTGDGVTLSRVCGEALADLITRPTETTAATQMPFVQSSFKKWEFEPARWLGINAGLSLATRADDYEQHEGREGWPHSLLRRLLGE